MVKFYLIDYIGVTGDKRNGWAIRTNRLNRKMLSCKSTKQSDVLDALWGWGVLPGNTGYKIVVEDGQYTVFEISTEKPMCAFFRFNGDL